MSWLSQIHHKRFQMPIRAMISPTHGRVSIHNVLLRLLIAMLEGVGLLFKMHKKLYEKGFMVYLVPHAVTHAFTR